MGKQNASGTEVANRVVSGQFTATGRSGNANTGINGGQTGQPPIFKDIFNIAIWGTFVATLQLEKSFDGGTTWLPVSKDSSGSVATYTSAVNLGIYEPEKDVLYSWNCTAYTSGTVNYRISQ